MKAENCIFVQNKELSRQREPGDTDSKYYTILGV